MRRNIFCILLLIFLTIRCQETSRPEFRDRNGNGKMEPYENTNLTLRQRAADLTERLSLEQKLSLIVGLPKDASSSMKPVAKEVVQTRTIPELGIPSLVVAEELTELQIAGTQQRVPEDTFWSISFPNLATIASTWNMDLAHETGKVVGSAAMEYGVDILFAPVLNSPVDPSGGWNSNSYSEDPYLSGYMTAEIAKGIQSNGIGSTVSPFPLNASREDTLKLNSKVAERARREIYLRGFEIAVKEALPWGVERLAFTSSKMRSFDSLLRKDWQFDGFIMADSPEASDPVMQLKAGSDLLINGDEETLRKLREAISRGDFSESNLNSSVEKILQAILRSPTFKGYAPSNAPDLEKHVSISRQVAREGIILLKNQNTLPLLETTGPIAIFGTASYDVTSGATANKSLPENYERPLIETLQAANYELDSELQMSYQNHIEEEKSKLRMKKSLPGMSPTIPEMRVSTTLAEQKAATTEIAIITIGRKAGGNTSPDIGRNFHLTESEESMINEISRSYRERKKKVIVVLHTGQVIDVASWKDKVDAIVLAWHESKDASSALTDVLSGKVNPSGKLPVSLPLTFEGPVPEATAGPAARVSRPEKLINEVESIAQNSIYVGYRYFSSFDVPVAYPFGYGLSYTLFEYSDFSTGSDVFYERFPVQVRITNTGSVQGKEIVQFYISAPDSVLQKPEIELKKFVKTSLLKPKASEVIEITLNYDHLASFDSDRGAWVVEPGTYKVYAASSSTDLKLSAIFTIEEERILKEVSKLDNVSRTISKLNRESEN